MTRAIIGTHAALLATGLTVNVARFAAGPLTWTVTAYTIITGLSLGVALIALQLPTRYGALLYGTIGTVGLFVMSGLSETFPWVLCLLPTGIIALGDALGMLPAVGYSALSIAASAVAAVIYRDPGAGLALGGLSVAALIGAVIMHRLTADNARLWELVARKEAELGDINIAIEIFANGRQ